MEYDMVVKEASEFGNGAHVIVPRKWNGSECIIIRLPKEE